MMNRIRDWLSGREDVPSWVWVFIIASCIPLVRLGDHFADGLSLRDLVGLIVEMVLSGTMYAGIFHIIRSFFKARN